MVFDRVYAKDFCAPRLKTLADPTRWAAIAQLMDCPRSVAELNASLKMEPMLLSHRLKILRIKALLNPFVRGKTSATVYLLMLN